MSAHETCSNCRWHEDEACHRYPPTATAVPVPVETLQGMQMELHNVTIWPFVTPDNWCGEHAIGTQLSH